MRQHISIKQLNELSEKGKERLKKWWKPLGNEYIYSPYYTKGIKVGWSIMQMNDTWAKDWEKMKELDWVKESLPLLSIGNMIEFLNNASIDVKLKNGKLYGLGYINGNRSGKELVDILWSAVKEKLEEEK